MRKFLLYMLLLSVSLPAFAADNEIKFGVTTSTRYNDNVNNVSSNEQDAVVFAIGPRMLFDTQGPKYEAGVSYSPLFTTYSQGGRVDQFDQYFGAHSEYRPTERLTLALRDTLFLERDADRDLTDSTVPSLDSGGNKQTLRNNLNGSARYGISQRASVTTNGGLNVIEREDKDLSDVEAISGRVQMDYVLSMRDTVGIGTSVRTQGVEDSIAHNRTQTNYYGFFLFASHRFSPTFGLSATGGPTWLRSRREDDQRSGYESDLDYFASVSLTADSKRGSASIAYTRTSSDVAFSSTTYLIDRVTATADWQISPRLFMGLKGEWNERTAVLRFSGENFANSVHQWLAAANVTYRMTPEVVAGFTVDYLRQEWDAAGADAVDRVRAVIRFDYNAQALRF